MRRISVSKKKQQTATDGRHELSGGSVRGRRNPYADLFLSIQRTADRLMQGLEDALRQQLHCLRGTGVGRKATDDDRENMTFHVHSPGLRCLG